MKSIKIGTHVLYVCMLMLLTSVAFAQTAPDAMVRSLTDNILTKIKSDASLRSGDPKRLMAVVDQNILPYADFQKTTQLAAGRYWKDATPQQQAALVKEFRSTLVRTYSAAVQSVKPQTRIELKPFRAAADAKDVVVQTQIIQPSGQPVQVDFRLALNGADQWKIYDVNVMGVWLIQNYRNQFSQQISKSGIDGLIESLAEKNKQFFNAKN